MNYSSFPADLSAMEFEQIRNGYLRQIPLSEGVEGSLRIILCLLTVSDSIIAGTIGEPVRYPAVSSHGLIAGNTGIITVIPDPGKITVSPAGPAIRSGIQSVSSY